MPREDELEHLLNGIEEAFDHHSPAHWRTSVQEVFNRMTADAVFEVLCSDGEFRNNPELRSFVSAYLGYKKTLGPVVLANGSAYRRNFWRRLISVPTTDSILRDGEEFWRICATSVVHELLHGFAQSSLSEAEKMNDAGFARHHPGGYEESLPLHDAAIRLEPDFALAWVNKGIALKNLSRIDEAIACYDHVIRKLDPEFKKAWHNKGVALRIDGRIEEAIECFDRAVEIDRHYAIAKRGRDECLAEKRNDRCVVDCPGVPREPAVLERIQMAGRLASQRNWLAAARMLENAGSGRTNSPCLSAQVGEWLFEGGDRRGSETHLRRALKLKLTCGVAWLNLTRCHLADGDLPAGLDAATRTTELIPEFSMAWANHAAALVALKRYSEAESSARKSLELDDRNGVALYNLGVSLRTQRRNAEARTALERFVTLCSDSPAVDSARDILSNL